MARKNPVLLRRGPVSGRIYALTNYRRSGDGPITVVGDGKHDVTAAFYALMLEELLDGAEHMGGAAELPSPDIIVILDGVADGDVLDKQHQRQVRSFRERLARIVEDHNARIESGELGEA